MARHARAPRAAPCRYCHCTVTGRERKLPRAASRGRLEGSRRAPLGPPAAELVGVAAAASGRAAQPAPSRLSPPSLPSPSLPISPSPSPLLGGGAARRGTSPTWIRWFPPRIRLFPVQIWCTRRQIRWGEGQLVHIDLAAAPGGALPLWIWHTRLGSGLGLAAVRPSGAAAVVPPVVVPSFPGLFRLAARPSAVAYGGALAGGCAPPPSLPHTTTPRSYVSLLHR
jgi:hypothetical protein